jgi:hypothetical protein
MDEMETAVCEAPDRTAAPCSSTDMRQHTKYDNFYTPKNDEFYSKFQYANLDQEERRIRLLRIQPLKYGEDNSSQVICELIDNQSLDAMQGKFTTLSYCAGDPKKTETIIINGLAFNAFSNLGHALRQVRHFWKDKCGSQELLLWTDQVCINQSNPHERSHQVGFMGDIYGSAIQVLICLSVEGDCGGGIGWLQEFASEFLEYEQTQPGKCSSDSDLNVDHGLNFFLEKWDGDSFHHGWDIFLAKILRSSWWRRAWIRQEFLRSPDAYFLAANEFVRWKVAAEAFDIYYNATQRFHPFRQWNRHTCPSSLRRLSDACQACFFINNAGSFFNDGKCVYTLLNSKLEAEIGGPCSQNLLYRLKEMYPCEASDPRDLVYACLGICSYTYGLYPDYKSDISVEDVFIKVAQNVITHSKSLDILRDAYRARVGFKADLPSWVPDWRDFYLPQKGGLSHPLPSHSTHFFTFHPDGRGRPNRILQVRGVLLGGLLAQKEDEWLKVISRHADRVPFAGGYRHKPQDSDEVYLLHGFGNLLVLRPRNKYFKLVGEVLVLDGILPGADLLVDELKRKVERNDPAVVTIQLC